MLADKLLFVARLEFHIERPVGPCGAVWWESHGCLYVPYWLSRCVPKIKLDHKSLLQFRIIMYVPAYSEQIKSRDYKHRSRFIFNFRVFDFIFLISFSDFILSLLFGMIWKSLMNLNQIKAFTVLYTKLYLYFELTLNKSLY